VQRILQLLRRAVHARATNACARKPTSWLKCATASASGRREVHLLGQIVNHYDAPDEPGCDFTGLLEAIHDVDGIERIRFASPAPAPFRSAVSRRDDAVAEDLPHLHIPVQSGSTRVLGGNADAAIQRESYLDLVARIRATLPDVALSTDMIVGFPGESAADFDETMSLTAAVRYHSMFSFKYSPRPNTLADKRLADDVSDDEKTRRIMALQALQRDIQSELNAALIGRTVDVLVDAASRRRATELSGRTSGNVVVNVPGRASGLGARFRFASSGPGPHSVWGRYAD
jgi:tRNA-2-methylthio-N6-dimethylallyladenosine synthase